MQSPYEDDQEHPIPFVDKLDVVVTSNVGVLLGIVIAAPLKRRREIQAKTGAKARGLRWRIRSSSREVGS